MNNFKCLQNSDDVTVRHVTQHNILHRVWTL